MSFFTSQVTSRVRFPQEWGTGGGEIAERSPRYTAYDKGEANSRLFTSVVRGDYPVGISSCQG